MYEEKADLYCYEIMLRLNALGFTDVVEGTVYTIWCGLRRINS